MSENRPPSDVRVAHMMRLFPPAADRHNVVTASLGVSKKAPLVYEAAPRTAYTRHLCVKPGVVLGTLGLPALFASESSVRTSFVAADLDETGPTDDRAVVLFSTLESLGIPFYVTTGTTGRGMHLYLFLEAPVSAGDGCAAAAALGGLVRDAGLALDKVLPQGPTSLTSMIFLPYAGAQADGYGSNPLLDPASDLKPVSLDNTSRIARVGVEELTALVNLGSQLASERPASVPRVLVPKADTLAALKAELGRLRPFWKEGVRQHLTLAVTALALVRLNLPPDVILSELEVFWRAAGDDGTSERLRAFTSTCKAYSLGKPVAFVHFYREAGIEPPAPIVSGELADALERLGYWETHALGSGLSGASDTKIIRTLYRAALRWGELTPGGVTVRMSQRQLAEQAQVTLKTVTASLKRLKSEKALASPKSNREPDQAGSFVLLTKRVPESVTLKPQDIQALRDLENHPAFRVRCLNPSAAAVIRTLYKVLGRSTTADLAQEMGVRVANLRRPLEKLVSHKVIEKVEGNPGHYLLPEDWRARLDRAAETTGAVSRVEKQKARHSAERDGYLEHIKRTQRALRQTVAA